MFSLFANNYDNPHFLRTSIQYFQNKKLIAFMDCAGKATPNITSVTGRKVNPSNKTAPWQFHSKRSEIVITMRDHTHYCTVNIYIGVRMSQDVWDFGDWVEWKNFHGPSSIIQTVGCQTFVLRDPLFSFKHFETPNR